MNFAATLSQQAERLNLLRHEIDKLGLDGFLVPLTDEFMNEYVPDSAQRLAWLTGFTGSAGLGLVLKNKAALFVDGRYTLQAAQQVDAVLYDLCHITKQPVVEYLKTHSGENAKIGFDPWLHTKSWIDKIEKSLANKGVKLEAVQTNPIDILWKEGRPAAPVAPVFVHPMRYAGEESSAKRKRLADELRSKNRDAVLITDGASIAWLLNIRGGDGPNTPLAFSYALLHKDGHVDWFIDARKIKNLPAQEGVFCHDSSVFLEHLQTLGQTQARIQIDFASTPLVLVQTLMKHGAVIEDGADSCELPKAIKNKAECEGMRDAHRRDGLALTRFLYWLNKQKAGSIDEIQAEEKLLELRKADNEFLYPSFPSISGAGGNGAIVHYRASEKTKAILAEGSFYLIDSGGQYPFGTTDVTRTVAIGTVTPAMKMHFTLVLKGHIALARVRFPQGANGGQLDILARQFLWQSGLDYDHGTGHGVGAFLGVHEGPQGISARSTVPLQEGMILSNEPGYYLSGAYGIRIENLVLVRKGQMVNPDKPMLEFETLTLAPIDRASLDSQLLERPEREWLNDYHARVFNAFASALTAEEKEWLQQATAPI